MKKHFENLIFFLDKNGNMQHSYMLMQNMAGDFQVPRLVLVKLNLIFTYRRHDEESDTTNETYGSFSRM